MGKLYVGMDAGKDDFKAVAKDERNNLVMPVRTYRYEIDALERLVADIGNLERQAGCTAEYGMEATGIYHVPLYRFLLEKRVPVKLFNGLEVKRFKDRVRKTKTDKLDAIAIAEALILRVSPATDPQVKKELVHLRELTRIRGRIIDKKVICKTQIKRNLDLLCRGYTDIFNDACSVASIAVIKTAIRQTRFFNTTPEALKDILVKTISKDNAETKAKQLIELFRKAVVPDLEKESCILETHMLIQQYELLEDQLERLERRIEKAVRTTGTFMTSITGIGDLTAGVMIGELGDIRRYKSVKQVTAFAGLDVVVSESGRSRFEGHISKRGSPNLRDALYRAALPASRYNPVCKALYDRLRSKGKHHKVALIAVCRKLLHIAYSVERNQRPFVVPKGIPVVSP